MPVTTPNHYAFIFARAGSKGVKNKNLRIVNGKSLLQRTIECAQQTQAFDAVIVSSNCPNILNAAESHGAQIIKRPTELCDDNSPELDSWKHAIRHFTSHHDAKPDDVFVSVPCTAPLRLPSDITKVLSEYRKKQPKIAIAITATNHSPYFNMVKKESDGRVKIVNNSGQFNRRQDVPPMYNITTVAYVIKFKDILERDRTLCDDTLGVEISPENALDIDTELDLKIAEALLQARK